MSQEKEREALLPCPFCGAGETQIHVQNGVWNGRGFGDPISVSVRHWCTPVQGQPSRMIERIGRDHESAIAAWNTRAALASQPPAVQGEPLTELLIEAEFGSDSNESYPDFLAGVRFAERYYGIHSRGEGEKA